MLGVDANKDTLSTEGIRRGRAREMLLAVTLLCALAHARDLRADGSVKSAGGDAENAAKFGAFAPSRGMLDSFSARDETVTGEFRPRKRGSSSAVEASRPLNLDADLQSSNVWQRMGQYRTFNGVRLLTLWQSRFNTVSVQTGKHGGPSLQWSSHVGGAGVDSTRGVLDRFIPGQKSSVHAALIGPSKPATQPAAKILAAP